MELKVPPVAVAAVFAALMWLVARATPLWTLPFPGRGGVAVVLVATGVTVGALGIREFLRSRTTVDPMRPERSSALVAAGIYRWSRNPMYVGLLLVLLGWAAYLSNLAAAPLTVLFLRYMTRFQIAPEERILRERFPVEFAQYAGRVRRWL